MEGSFAKELYSETLQLQGLAPSTTNFGQSHSSGHDEDEDDLQDEDGSLWGGSDEEVDKASDLEREWKNRRNQFHNIGFREGLMAAQEHVSQEGFNEGFRQSVVVGYNWGIVRGITSAFACLPDGLKEKVMESQEKRKKMHDLYESVHSISTKDVLGLFYDDIKKKAVKQIEDAEANANAAGSQKENSDSSHLENYVGALHSLIRESPSINSHLHQK